MSHFTKCNLKIKNLVALKKALADLNHTFAETTAEQTATVRGYKGAKIDAELSIDMGKYDVGVVQQADGSYELVADWWGIETTRGTTEKEFVEELNQRYAYQQVVIACEEQGYAMEETKNEETGTISVTMKKWE
jgi:hypothetical protein